MHSYKSKNVKMVVQILFFISLHVPALTVAGSDTVAVQGTDMLTASNLENYRTAAEHGHAEAQDILGLLYYRGDGVEKSYSKALKWFLASANQGNKEAQYHLALMYYFQIAVSGNQDDKALTLFKKAAEQGHVRAQFAVGMMYYNGDVSDGSAEYAKAMHWIKMSASQGYPLAQNQLGVLYETGKGVDKNLSKAEYWYLKSAARGCRDGINNFARLDTQADMSVKVSYIESISENVDNEEYSQTALLSSYNTNSCYMQCKSEHDRCNGVCGTFVLLGLASALAGYGNHVPDCSSCDRVLSSCRNECQNH